MAGGYNGGNANQQKAPSTPFKGPTVGCEHVVFDAMPGKKSKQAGEFNNNVEALGLAIVASGQIKRGKANVTKAMKTGDPPDFAKMQSDLGPRPDEDEPFDREQWIGDAREIIDEKRYWKENNQLIFSLLLSHCTQSTRTHLKSMDCWDDMFEAHDGLAVLSAIRATIFGTDGSAQTMLELVRAWKSYANCWQYDAWSLDKYFQESEARWHTANDLMGPPGLCKATMTIVAGKDGLSFEGLGDSDSPKFTEYARRQLMLSRRLCFLRV